MEEIKEPAKPEGPTRISIDDFKKVEIRIGEIVSAEKVPETDKLSKLSVNFGNETRQIVSGIALYVTPESLVGKRVAFTTNLETRVIKGLESQGMILGASDAEGKFSLLETHDVAPGAWIK